MLVHGRVVNLSAEARLAQFETVRGRLGYIRTGVWTGCDSRAPDDKARASNEEAPLAQGTLPFRMNDNDG